MINQVSWLSGEIKNIMKNASSLPRPDMEFSIHIKCTKCRKQCVVAEKGWPEHLLYVRTKSLDPVGHSLEQTSTCRDNADEIETEVRVAIRFKY